jgi:hypothetical protein
MSLTNTAEPARRMRAGGRRSTPVDEVLPAPRLFILGLQHLFIMYAGAVPLIVGGALAAGLLPAVQPGESVLGAT